MAVTKKTKAAPKKAAETKKVKNNTHKSDTMAKEDNKLMLFIAYFIGIFSIIIYLIKKDDSVVKFHCLQSIVFNIAVVIYSIILSILSVILSVASFMFGGICGFIVVPLLFVPLVYWLYILYKVATTGDMEIPHLTEFVKKNLKQYY